MNKTEIMWFEKPNPPTNNLTIKGQDFTFQNDIKSLGITVNRSLSWDDHLENVIQKGKKTEDRF